MYAHTFLHIQSMVRTNRNEERMHPCLTPVMIANFSEQPLFINIEYFESLKRASIMLMNMLSIPYSVAMFYKVSLHTILKAF